MTRASLQSGAAMEEIANGDYEAGDVRCDNAVGNGQADISGGIPPHVCTSGPSISGYLSPSFTWSPFVLRSSLLQLLHTKTSSGTIHASGLDNDPDGKIRFSADLRFADMDHDYDHRWTK
jgi:hypothetical protein